MKIVTGPQGYLGKYGVAGALAVAALGASIIMDGYMVKPTPWWMFLVTAVWTICMTLFGIVIGSKIDVLSVRLAVEQTCAHKDCDQCAATRRER